MAYTEQEARALVIEAGHRLLENRLIARTWGNISARISDTQFIITPSGRAYDTLQPEDLVKVNMGDGSCEGRYPPSSEKGVHASAYKLRPGVDFVIHTHQFYASAVGVEGADVPFAPCAPYGLPGTKKLKRAVQQTISDHPQSKAFLMVRHGALCLGDSFNDAFAVAEKLEKQCKTLFEQRVSLHTEAPDNGLDTGSIKGLPFVRRESDPFTAEWSRRNRPLRPYIDDFAQLVGYRAPVCPADPRIAERLLRRHSAVLLSGCGALCTADTAADAQAVSMILQKNCAAALYARSTRPLPLTDALLQRAIYLNKYSKQRDR